MRTIDFRHRVDHAPGGVTHWIDLDGLPNRIPGPRALYWTLNGITEMPAPPVLDHFVIGLALPLSAAGGEVRVRGAMSRQALFNVNRLLDLRRATTPGTYRPLRIIPDDLVDGPPHEPGDRRAILAFSGGLDSTHAALRHLGGPDRADSLDLKALVMAHGFDAPLDRTDVFARMLQRATPLAQHLGVPLYAVETNSKLLGTHLWPQTSTPLSAMILSLFWPMARFGIFGGGLPYNANFLSRGHQPLFDQYCSGDRFAMVTDGTGLTRPQKLRNISGDQVALTGLRVCWQGRDVSRNCGQCPKCLLTMLNMRMAGLDERLAFDAPLDLRHICAMHPRTLYDARDLAEFTWSDLRRDPALITEAQAVRAVLAGVPPVSVTSTIVSAIWTLVIPHRLRRMLTVLGGPGRRIRRLSRRTIRRIGSLRVPVGGWRTEP